MVVKNYKPDMKDEMNLQLGSVVEVVEKTMDGWWLIRCKGEEGRAPATNLRRANTAKAQHILEKSSQATLEAQVSDLLHVESQVDYFVKTIEISFELDPLKACHLSKYFTTNP